MNMLRKKINAKKGNRCIITMLKVGDGDCFFLEFFFEKNTFSIMIDSGRCTCWKQELMPFLDNLIQNNKRINVLLITHIDADHIGGAIKVFQQQKYSDIVDEVWFNGLRQIIEVDDIEATDKDEEAFYKLQTSHWHDFQEPTEEISAKQALMFAGLLHKRGKKVNTFIAERAITQNTVSFELSPNFYIDFLLPKEKSLNKLEELFKIDVFKAVWGAKVAVTPNAEAAFEHVMLDNEVSNDMIENIAESKPDIYDIEKWAHSSSLKDTSDTNAASVAICIRFYGKKLLFTGDANAEDLLEALDNWQKQYNETLYFEVIKLPHHGSANNCCKLLDKIDGKYYLVSTDGKKFAHPNKETIAKIVVRAANDKRYILFNYENTIYKLFHNTAIEEKYNYFACYQTEALEI